MAEEIKYLGQVAVEQLVTEIKAADAAALQAAKAHAEGLADNYDAAGTAATKVQELADGQVKTNTEAIAAINNEETGILKQAKDYADGKAAEVQGNVDVNTGAIGTMDNLETTAKGDLVSAINEVRSAVSAGGTAAAVTMEEKTSDLGEGIAKAYVLKQGETTVGTINIPKDMVVQSGEVVVDPEGQPAGTYIKLVLANATNDVIYVNVGTLVDIYKAKASAAQVQIAIDSATREISASIVAGSITATELAADAVVTAKIADGNVTKAKLSTEVQASLDKADAAAGLAQTAENNAKAHANDLNTAMNTRVEALEAIDHEHANADVLNGITADKVAAWDAASGDAADALAGVKSELEGKIADAKKAGTDAQADIDALEQTHATDKAALEAADSAMQAEIDALKAVTHTEITAAEITAMFAS